VSHRGEAFRALKSFLYTTYKHAENAE